MKIETILVCCILALNTILFAGCSTGVGSAGGITWDDSPTRTSTLSIGAATASGSFAVRAAATADRIYFRSSDIEFWSIGSVTEIGNLVSAKYVDTVDYSANHSLEYIIGNAAESIVFRPDTDVRLSRNDQNLNPNWESRVAAFLAAGHMTINVMRLDIGAGYVTFVIDGVEREVFTSDGGSANRLNGNSVVFVDEAFLSEPIHVPGWIEQDVIGGTATAASLGISESDFEVVRALHTSSNWVDSATPIDVNGALILPMTPVDITGFNPDIETLDIVISWDVANAFHQRDGSYFVDERVGGTPFDFAVTVVRGEYVEEPILDPGDPGSEEPPVTIPDHQTRLAGSGVSLDDYDVESTTSSGDMTWTTYGRKASSGAGTSGSVFVQAVPDIWETLPTMGQIVGTYGAPPALTLVDTTHGVYLTFGYDTGSLYFGPDGDSVWEIRFSEDDQPGFSLGGVHVGSPIADVTAAFGAPVGTVSGDIEWVDRVLYLRPGGGGYISYNGAGVRFFFTGPSEASLVVVGMYLYAPEP